MSYGDEMSFHPVCVCLIYHKREDIYTICEKLHTFVRREFSPFAGAAAAVRGKLTTWEYIPREKSCIFRWASSYSW